MLRSFKRRTRVVVGLVAGLAGIIATTAGVQADCTPQWFTSSGTNGAVTALTALPNGDLLAGGDFTMIEGTPAHHVAIQHNGVWSALGAPAIDGPVYTVAKLSNGNIMAGGAFDTLYGGTVIASGIAVFDGTSWHPFVPSQSYLVWAQDIEELDNGHILIAGFFGVEEWDGIDWLPLAPHTFGTGIHDVLVLPNGNIVVTGGFEGGLYAGDPSSALRIAMYDGFGWQSLGYGLKSTGEALALLPNGDIVVGGRFTAAIGTTPAAQHVLRWDGMAWHPMAGGLGGTAVFDLLTMPSGDLIAGGVFFNPVTTTYDAEDNPVVTPEINNIARWDGTSWQPLGLGVKGPPLTQLSAFSLPTVSAMALTSDGTLVVGGTLTSAGGQPSAYLARYGCPPAPACAADFNGDHVRDVADLFGYINAWLAKTPSADFNHDTLVDVADLFGYINAWLAGC